MGANYSAKIFNNAVSALGAQQAIIANISNNIANVNTEGYCRRTLELQSRVSSNRAGGFSVGNGVEVGSVSRSEDEFLEKVLREANGEFRNFEIQDELLGRLESVFSLSEDIDTIGTALSEFFNAVDNLSVNPASIELRSELIERGNDLTTMINNTYNTIASIQEEADNRLTNEITAVNNLTSQIATLNGLIQSREGSGSVAASERDQRDVLIQELGEKISFNMVETSDGSVTISLSSGFPLVSGADSRELELTKSPSFSGGNMPPSLSGGILSHVVYDYDPTGSSAHIDLTQILQAGDGIVGGLLTVRGFNDVANTSPFSADGPLVAIASRVEAIARELLTTVNLTNLGPDRGDTIGFWDPSSGDLDGNTPGVYGLFTAAGLSDADANGEPDDLNDATINIDSYAGIIQMAISDPRDVAAARDVSGGPPAARSFAEGDNQNLAAISALQNTDMNFAIGSYSLTATFNDAYNESVGKIGSYRNTAETNYTVAANNRVTAQNRRDEVSGVSLDEEFTSLIKFQKAFEANARVLRTAQELINQIVGMI